MANSYLNRTVSSASNRRTFTFSAWIKRSKLGTVQSVIGADSGGGTNFGIQFQTNDTLAVFQGSSTFLVTTQVFRDISAWYHLVLAVDTTNSTADNRVRLYNNGTEITSFGTRNNPSVNTDLAWNNNVDNTVGADKPTSGVRNYFDGYISHAANVDGQQLAPTVFGSTDSTSGIWKFKSPSGVTWGTNGFHLKFENSGAMGTDSSGNSNTYTVGGNLKQAVDTPSNVYATMNPFSQKDPTVVYGNGNNKIFYNQTSTFAVYSTLAASSGKWYAECEIDAVGAASSVGVISVDTANLRQYSQDFIGQQTDSIGYLQNGEIKKANSNQQTGLTSFSNGTIVGIAMDLDNNTVQFYINGSSTGNTVSLTADKFYYFGDAGHSDAGHLWNFGNGYFGTTAITSAGSNGNGSLFEYDVPSGYYALNTKNINTYG
jgi:hypothetical protein